MIAYHRPYPEDDEIRPIPGIPSLAARSNTGQEIHLSSDECRIRVRSFWTYGHSYNAKAEGAA